MKELICVLASVIIAGYAYNLYQNRGLTTIKSSSNNKEYLVRELEDKQDAANLLANIGDSFDKLVKYVSTDSHEGVEQLVNKFNSNNIKENIPSSEYTAYSVNKGEELVLCLRNINDNSFIDINTILFVGIHELAHIMTDEVGHTEKFWSNMEYLVTKANEINIYNPIDYSKYPTDYCGQEINTTPYKFK